MNDDRKTIFLVITRGFLARNVISSGLFSHLQDKRFRYVVMVPDTAIEMMKQDLGDDVIIEPIVEPKMTAFRKHVFTFILRFSLISSTSVNLAWHGSGKARQYKWFYGALFPILFLLSLIPNIRGIFQWLDYKLYPNKENDHYFEKYHPSLVIASSIIGQADAAFIKAARRYKVPSVSMTKGWDNLDKFHMQTKSDYIVVQNEPLRGYAKKYQGYKDNEIFVGGFPAFDVYSEHETFMSRDEVCNMFGFDPTRKILFYGSEGVWSSNDKEIIGTLINWMNDNEYSDPCSLIIRPHFSDIKKGVFDEFKGLPNVHVYDEMRLVDAFYDGWYADKDEMRIFGSVMKALDVMICIRSTLTLDAIMFDRPVINVTSRAYIEPNGKDATINLYKHIFYRDLMMYQPATLVDLGDGLRAAINTYLEDPSVHRNERARAREIYCHGGGHEGHASEEIAAYIKGLVTQ